MNDGVGGTYSMAPRSDALCLSLVRRGDEGRNRRNKVILEREDLGVTGNRVLVTEDKRQHRMGESGNFSSVRNSCDSKCSVL